MSKAKTMGKNIFLGFLLSVSTGVATTRAEVKPGPWNVGFALSFPDETGKMENALENGFGFNCSFGYQPPDRLIGARMDFLYSGFRISQKVIDSVANGSDGNVQVLGGGASVVLSPPLTKWLRPSLYAGPGLYYETAEVTANDGCDPIFGCPAGGSEYAAARLNTTRLGWQGGAGLDFLFDGGLGAISLNVQYIQINNTNADMTFIPINIGYKVMF